MHKMLALLVRLVYNMCVSKKETREYPMKVGDKVVIKGEKNLWTVEEVFPCGDVSIKSVYTGFKMSCNPSSLEIII